MASTSNEPEGNGYLRQGEFRRWANTVDRTLADLSDQVREHGEMLAVYKDRHDRDEGRRKTVSGIVSAIVAALVSALLHYWKP